MWSITRPSAVQKLDAVTVCNKGEVFEIPLSAYQAEGQSDIQGRILKGLKRKILK